ncbi:MAG: hypothetical protein ABEJ26_11870 [Halosimplex sp.]
MLCIIAPEYASADEERRHRSAEETTTEDDGSDRDVEPAGEDGAPTAETV